MKKISKLLMYLSTIIIFLGIFYIGFKIYNYKQFKTILSGDNIKIENINPVELNVSCEEEKDSIITTMATFNLKFKEDVSEEYVKNVISLEPSADYQIEKINNKYYKLKTISDLQEGKVYNIIQTTTEGTEKWAFQTEKNFELISYYPTEFCSEDATINLTFNLLPKNNFSDYVTIEPAIQGKWVVRNYEVRFEHFEPFNIDTEYTVKINKGLESKENSAIFENDFEFKFYVSDSSAPNLSIVSADAFKTNEDIKLNIYYSGRTIDFDDYKIKILDVKTKENFINILKSQQNKKEIKQLWTSEEFKTIYTQDLTDENSKVENLSSGYACSSQVSLQITAEGYYASILKYKDYYAIKPIQINNYTVTCNVLKNNELFILTKGVENKNNSIEVYINGNSIGKTDNDGILFIEDYKKLNLDLNNKFNYIEFATPTAIVLNAENAIYKEIHDEEDRYTQFSNGYLYTDREVYDVGETIKFWGFAKNRVKEINDVILVIEDTYNKFEIPLKLDEKGCFTYEYLLDNINSGSYVSCYLKIDNIVKSYKHIKIVDYSIKNYDIEVTSDKEYYLNGDKAILNINASNYDGTKLKDLEISYEASSQNMDKVLGKVITDVNGNAKIEIPLNLNVTTNTLHYVDVKILNSLDDGEQENITLNVYPHKNTVNITSKYIINQNTYKLDFDEYSVFNREIPANDNIVVKAIAYKTEKYLRSSFYDEYKKEMVYVYSNRDIKMPEFDKIYTVNIERGKGVIYIPNWNEEYKNNKYQFEIYIYANGQNLYIQNEYYIENYLNEKDLMPYNDGNPDLLTEKGYSLQFEKDIYQASIKFGDTIKTILKDENGSTIQDYSNIEIYTYILSGEGDKVIKTKNKNFEFIYTEKMGNNISIYSLIYDGEYAYSAMDYYESKSIYIDKDEVKLDLKVTFDKQIYAPGEEAIITIKTLDHGKPISAEVNISAVDTAFVDVNGESSSRILESLENYYYYFAKEISTRKFKQLFEGGGGGGDGEPRMNLLTTAIFESVITNNNGEAKIKVKLPENITEWTVTSQAISDNFKVAMKKQSIKVAKDFYVDFTFAEKYLKDEKFELNIKSFSEELNSNSKVNYTISILDEQNNIVEEEKIEGNINSLTSYKIKNNLEKGKYKIKLLGNCENFSDGIIQEIDIVDNLLTLTYREELEMPVNTEIKLSGNSGALYVSNKEIAKIIKDLFELINLNEYRNDSKAIKKEAKRILTYLQRVNTENLLNVSKDYYEAKEDNYYINTAMKLMANSSENPELALRILSIGSAKNGYTNEVLNRIEETSSKEAVLWAYASTGKTVLKELRTEKENIIEEISTKMTLTKSSRDVLYVALGLADIGDYKNAIELFNILKDEVSIENISDYELLTILAIKLNLPEREQLYENYLTLNMPPENEDFVKLYYIQNEISKNVETGKLILTINGEEQKIIVNNIGFKEITLKQTDKIVLKEKTENIQILLEDKKAVDFEKYTSNGYIISKEYIKQNNTVGDLYTVEIMLDMKKITAEAKDYLFRLEDVIPNNMTFVSYDGDTGSYLEMKDGQKLIINCINNYIWNKNQKQEILTVKYTVRQTNGGEQKEAGTILVNANGNIIDALRK